MDNAFNNDGMVRCLAQSLPSIDPTEHRLRCLAHVVNLAAKTLINNVGAAPAPEFDEDDADPEADDSTGLDLGPAQPPPGPVAKVSFGVHYIRRSPLRRTLYRAAAEDLELPDVTLVSDNETRFNSVCNMIRSALPQQLAIDQFVWEEQFQHGASSKTRNQLRRHLLSTEDWRELEVLYRLLRPFETCTLATEGTSTLLLKFMTDCR
jgi:hypothetical protein